jgi:hypothetical protein
MTRPVNGISVKSLQQVKDRGKELLYYPQFTYNFCLLTASEIDFPRNYHIPPIWTDRFQKYLSFFYCRIISLSTSAAVPPTNCCPDRCSMRNRVQDSYRKTYPTSVQISDIGNISVSTIVRDSSLDQIRPYSKTQDCGCDGIGM